VQTTHTAICNARSRLDQRLARWLLMAHDRLGTNLLPLTHEFLSLMLGVRRAGVTEALGLIANDRSQITVRDRKDWSASRAMRMAYRRLSTGGCSQSAHRTIAQDQQWAVNGVCQFRESFPVRTWQSVFQQAYCGSDILHAKPVRLSPALPPWTKIELAGRETRVQV
jgi:Crp-like helix-turn-helix domain